MGTSNMTAGKKMKGFMCHCPASTAVCMSQEYRAVALPAHRATLRHHQAGVGSHGMRYIRLGEKNCAIKHVRKDQQKVEATPGSLPISMLSCIKKDEQKRPSLEDITISRNVFQVVVMRVSIHCNGCAGKLKKHLSRMEGVTSFNIDLESKRVTVMGNVSPSGVLESVSKVKKAEFWPTC